MDICGKRLILGDDFGDNECTFVCELPKDHKGNHIENFSANEGNVTVIFEVPEESK